jgi:hypothetical protein
MQIERMFSNASSGADLASTAKAAKATKAAKAAKAAEAWRNSSGEATFAGSSLLANPHNGTKIAGSRHVQALYCSTV